MGNDYHFGFICYITLNCIDRNIVAIFFNIR